MRVSIRTTLYTILTLALSAMMATPAAAVSNTDNAVYHLAQQCYAIRSPGTGKYLTNNSGVFAFSTTNSGQAGHFFMKPARLGDFLLTDRGGKYLSSLVPLVESPLSNPGTGAEWQTTATDVGGGHFRFRFTNRATQSPIQFEYVKTIRHSWWWFHWYTYETHVERDFDVVAQSDCRPYPEISADVSGDRNRLKGDVNAPVRGYVDAHNHLTSYEFMGGKVMHGEPFDQYGVSYALNNSVGDHGIDGSLDLIGNIFVYGTPTHTYNTAGWPNFPWWPNHTQLTHTGFYYKWVKRAWLSGERVMVVDLVENKVLCNIQETVNPISYTSPNNSCNTMDSIRLQAKRLHQLQDYIDAQAGGPGKGFFRLVTSPEQARQVIANGKLAVVMGVEASETLNCGVHDYCTEATIDQGLDELYNLGVRSMFPIHKFDNQFGGSVLENGFINIGEALSTGHYYQAEECDADTRGKAMTSGFPIIGNIPVISDLIAQIGVTPQYSDSKHLCNTRGLTPLGVYLVNRMIDHHMIIELDHMSEKSTTESLDIAEARHYSGVVSSHSFFHRARDGSLHKNFYRMLNLGGFSAPYNSDANGDHHRIDEYLGAVEKTPYLAAVGIGTDMGGLGGQPGPRSDANTNPLIYPFTSEFGLTFHRQVSGNRTFDLNKDGIAQYGLLADEIQDIRQHAGSRAYNALMNSAEGYLEMWERTDAHVGTNYVNPL